MDLINEIIGRFNARDIEATIDMQLSTESLDLLDQSPYQTEIAFNQLLPYADKLDDEADTLFAKIKANFGRCVMLRDINPGCVYWSQMLTKYVLLYGLRFTKDEHIAFIKLSYNLITIPNLQPSLIDTFGKLLLSLLKKKETISPNELELQWEPLYKLCSTLLARKSKQYTLYRYPMLLESTLETVVQTSKIYFPPSATQEILDELRPKLCPLDTKVMYTTFKLLRWFLPVQLPVEYHAVGHELWFREFMEIWDVCHNMHHWENDLMRLMAKLASKNIGYIDWDPYIPLMFTRFVRTLNLPVHYKKTMCKSNHNIEIDAIGVWIASILGNNSKAQIYLEKFLKTIETYFHPANFGMWLIKLEDLFVRIIYFVVLRLHRERHAKKTWELPIPDSHKLTEANVDDFVNSMIPVAMTAVFNKRCSQNVCYALQYLAMMRPNLVIPNVLEKLYPSLGTDIEPHKLITAMTCMVSISRPLVQGLYYNNKDYAFPEGPSHALPLLFSSLPGIDPNDPNKCFVTFRLIATYVTLIPIVDCSNSKADMSDDERMLCEQTSRFEDFVLQFMDKVFILIDSSSLEFVRLENQSNDGEKSTLESMAENALYGVFTSLLLQTSDSIFTSALNKFRTFIMENTLETKIAGQLVAVMCRVFSRVNSQLTVKTLLPYLSEKILDTIGDGEEIINEENLDNQLLYSLLLLQRVVETQGDVLLPYMDTIENVLKKVTLLKSREGNQLGCQMLKNVLDSLCSVQAIRLDKNLDNPEYPYYKDWGESIEVKSAQIRWYIPGEQEMAAANRIFYRYFQRAMDDIQFYVTMEDSISRDELRIKLRIVNSVIEGCDSLLPIWPEPPLVSKLYESCVATFQPIIGNNREINLPDGSNVRHFVVRIMTMLQDKLQKEDDAKSLLLLAPIWQNLSMNKSKHCLHLSIRRRHFRISKKIVEDKLIGNKGYLPQFLLERVAIQHELRKANAVHTFTETSKDIVVNLFKLSISQYSRIRMKAQNILWGILNDFPNAYQLLMPHVIEVLGRDTEVHHDAYKGVLYLIIQNQGNSFLTKGDWQVLSNLLPALVLSKPSEKPTVIRQQDYIITTVTKNFTTTNITLDVPDNCISSAAELWNNGVKPSLPQPTQEDIQKGIEILKELGHSNLQGYNDILDKLVHTILEKNLHWRHQQMAMNFISALVHPDHPLPTPVVRYFLNALIHDSIDERKLAWTMTMYILKQLKRTHPKIILDIANRENSLKPGRRADNEWLQYSYEKRPITAAQWDEPRYVHKLYVGYYTWPKQVDIYAPSSQQPSLDRKSRRLNDREQEVDLFFNDKQNVAKLVKFLTLEEKKGKDKFNQCRYLLFKGLFRNHGDAYLANFLPHLHEMVQDKQESVQRCAAEIICGLIRGSKHWPFQMTHDMWQVLLPIIKVVLNNLTEETISDWVTCFSTANRNRDPSRLHWLIECLTEESQLAPSEASFVECARLFIMQGALMSQAWRMSEVLTRLLPRFESRLLENPFENVRDRLASILVSIFNTNLKFQRSSEDGQTGYPEIQDFVDKVYPRLELLLTEEDSKSPAYIESTRLLNIVCRWISESIAVSHFGAVSSFYKLYPIVCQLENNETDEELSKSCTRTLAVLAQVFTLPEHVPAALQSIEAISRSKSWSARASCMQFLQVFLFHNMSTLLSDDQWIGVVRTVVLRLLQDKRVEVRERSAQVLNGMLHCTLVSNEQALLEEFKQMAKTKLRNKKSESTNSELIDAIRLRHAGVLGMCAFIQAHPYDIPKDIPPIFQYLSLHLNDPEPIPATIRKTLNDFKRTHCDGWTGLQGLAQVLNEEQFALLQDLTVPPSYYA